MKRQWCVWETKEARRNGKRKCTGESRRQKTEARKTRRWEMGRGGGDGAWRKGEKK